MVSAREDKVADETFVAVDDEVSAKLFGLFVVFYKVCGRHTTEVTSC